MVNISSYAIGWMVALAFTMGAAAGGSIELLHWREKFAKLRGELLRQRQLSDEMSRTLGLLSRNQW